MQSFVYRCPICGAESRFYVHKDGWDSEWGCDCAERELYGLSAVSGLKDHEGDFVDADILDAIEED